MGLLRRPHQWLPSGRGLPLDGGTRRPAIDKIRLGSFMAGICYKGEGLPFRNTLPGDPHHFRHALQLAGAWGRDMTTVSGRGRPGWTRAFVFRRSAKKAGRRFQARYEPVGEKQAGYGDRK